MANLKIIGVSILVILGLIGLSVGSIHMGREQYQKSDEDIKTTLGLLMFSSAVATSMVAIGSIVFIINERAWANRKAALQACAKKLAPSQ